jgi:hypothetical protein
MSYYYKLNDLDALAKQDGGTAYIYNKETRQWEVDTEGLFQSRLVGLDGEADASCERISEAQANALINGAPAGVVIGAADRYNVEI